MRLGTCLIFLLFIPFVAFAESCPTGFVAVEYDDYVVASGGECPSGYVAHDIDVACSADTSAVCWVVEQLRELCDAGISNIKTSTGLSIPLYATQATEPSMHVQYNNVICYGDLELGRTSNALNVDLNGTVYHLVE